MDSDGHIRPKSIGDLPAREYAVRAAKASLSVACWAGIVAALLIYGPPAMSVPTARLAIMYPTEPSPRAGA